MQIDVVATAYDELKALNLTPTVRRLRERIGYGSMTDITELLAQVRTERTMEEVAANTLPDRLKVQCDRFLFQLWASMRAETDEKLAVLESATEERFKQVSLDQRALLMDADGMMLEIDELKLRIEELQKELALEKALRTDREKDLAVAELRLADQVVRTTALQRSLDLALTGITPLPAELSADNGAGEERTAEVTDLILRYLDKGVTFNLGDVTGLPELVHLPPTLVSESIDALVKKGIIAQDPSGDFSVVTKAPGRRKVKRPTPVRTPPALSGVARRKA